MTADEEGEGWEVVLAFVDDDDTGLFTTMPCGGGDGEAKSEEGWDGESGEPAEARRGWRRGGESPGGGEDAIAGEGRGGERLGMFLEVVRGGVHGVRVGPMVEAGRLGWWRGWGVV